MKQDERKRRVLIVEDKPVVREGMQGILEELGYDVITDYTDAQSVLEYLEKSDDIYMVMVDKQIPEAPGMREEEGVGPNLLLAVYERFPLIPRLVLYTHLREANISDVQKVLRTEASAIAFSSGSKEKKEEIIDQLKRVVKGDMVISPMFKRFAREAMDPENQCPLDPVEYYCARLISENLRKEGAANKWKEFGKEVTFYMVDELLEDVYGKLQEHLGEDWPKPKKEQKLSEWYHYKAVLKYGRALPVPYEPRAARSKNRQEINRNPS